MPGDLTPSVALKPMSYAMEPTIDEICVYPWLFIVFCRIVSILAVNEQVLKKKKKKIGFVLEFFE